MATQLSPSQQREFDRLMGMLPVGNIFVLYTGSGMGCSTLLKEVHRTCGGKLLTMQDFVDSLENKHPLQMEETLYALVLESLRSSDVVVMDDLSLIESIACNHFYQRSNMLRIILTALTTYAIETDKKLIFGASGAVSNPVNQRCYYAGFKHFAVEDYEFLCKFYLNSARGKDLDYSKIFRFAPKLNAHQLKGACLWLNQEESLTTERFIDYLYSQRLASNVDLGEVQQVDLHDLKGVERIIQELEANIIVPLEQDELAARLSLKPKRGVLLVGPPGTGKTTVGRALAHRLRGKFFLIDGTFIVGTNRFYEKIREVFDAAKQNAPSIIFIDDTDAIFEGGEELGLYRYLLTKLDGLESESSGGICVMMTAMNVGDLPPALIRSGRIELWLEMNLPDEAAREQILRTNLDTLPEEISHPDIARIVQATEGFTGADLKRLVDDAKVLYAYDLACERQAQPATSYYLAAVEKVLANKERYMEAEAIARQHRPQRPPWFRMYSAYVSDDDE